MTVQSTELSQKIIQMSDGDDEFREELTHAIHNGLVELKKVYADGAQQKDIVKIQQIRHKLKPTLAMFEFESLITNLQEGKELLESTGFDERFEEHLKDFLEKVDITIQEVEKLK